MVVAATRGLGDAMSLKKVWVGVLASWRRVGPAEAGASDLGTCGAMETNEHLVSVKAHTSPVLRRLVEEGSKLLSTGSYVCETGHSQGRQDA